MAENMSSIERSKLYKRLLLRGVLLILGAGMLCLLLPRILSLVAPFLIAIIAAMLLNPLVTGLQHRLHINRKLSAFFLTVLVVGALFLLLYQLLYTIISESVSLASNIDAIWSYTAEGLESINRWLTNMLPSNGESELNVVAENLHLWLQSTSRQLLDSALGFAAGMTTTVGNTVVVVIIALLAVYFSIDDYPKIVGYAKTHTEHHLYQLFQKVKQAVRSAFSGYLKAQLLLALLAFAVMFTALAIYGQRYALLIAIGLGIVDFLPIVGTIAVLLPWAVIEFLAGDLYKALFLLILAVGFFLLRKIVEPKIVGSQTGLHPLMALLSIYAGMKLSGIWGAVLGPVMVMVAMNIYRSGIFDATIADLRDLYHIARSMLKRP